MSRTVARARHLRDVDVVTSRRPADTRRATALADVIQSSLNGSLTQFPSARTRAECMPDPRLRPPCRRCTPRWASRCGWPSSTTRRQRPVAEGAGRAPRPADQPARPPPRRARARRARRARRLGRRRAAAGTSGWSATPLAAARPIAAGRPRRRCCSCARHNSARSQLAAALWTARTGAAGRVGRHAPGAAGAPRCGRRGAARRARPRATPCPRLVGTIPADTQVVTVCDRVHEELEPRRRRGGTGRSPTRSTTARAAAFDAVVAELDARIDARSSRSHDERSSPMTVRLGINGFGRMGRLVVRALRQHPELELVHVNETRATSTTAAHLLEFDTRARPLRRRASASTATSLVDRRRAGRRSPTHARPGDVPWDDHGVDIVLECTGKFTHRRAARAVLRPRRAQGGRGRAR